MSLQTEHDVEMKLKYVNESQVNACVVYMYVQWHGSEIVGYVDGGAEQQCKVALVNFLVVV